MKNIFLQLTNFFTLFFLLISINLRADELESVEDLDLKVIGQYRKINDFKNLPLVFKSSLLNIRLENFCGFEPSGLEVIQNNLKHYEEKLPAIINRFNVILQGLKVKGLDLKDFFPITIFLGVDGSENCERIEVQIPGDVHVTVSAKEEILNHHTTMFPHELFHALEYYIHGEADNTYSEFIADVFWRIYHKNNLLFIPSESPDVDESLVLKKYLNENLDAPYLGRLFLESTIKQRSKGNLRDFRKPQASSDFYRYFFNPYYVSTYLNSKIRSLDGLKKIIKMYLENKDVFFEIDPHAVLKRVTDIEPVKIENIPEDMKKDIQAVRLKSDSEEVKLAINIPEELQQAPVLLLIQNTKTNKSLFFGALRVDQRDSNRQHLWFLQDDSSTDVISDELIKLTKDHGINLFSSNDPIILKFITLSLDDDMYLIEKRLQLPSGIYHIEGYNFDINSLNSTLGKMWSDIHKE